jgi:hypothetical protein
MTEDIEVFVIWYCWGCKAVVKTTTTPDKEEVECPKCKTKQNRFSFDG